jgi:signal peptidase II
MTLKADVIALICFGLDHLVKYQVTTSLAYGDRVRVWPFFDLVRWHNEGAAFSVLATAGGWQRWFFVILGSGFSLYILYELRRLPRGARVMVWVYGLILGGALGNLADRILQGYVVDFLLFYHGEWYVPAFYLADTFLFCGAVLWILLMITESRQQAHNGATVPRDSTRKRGTP